ncbi:hypothetical protein [Candidatus Palauibacter sp.]|uniref:hypothetical protein n=1 Tax=Candidatus Palauibacter sp. TaxID=3101350 RepID=UPI003D152713
MFRLDDEIRDWRADLEDKRWFSPLELDELEDHLRSHASEELELGPSPESALAFEAAVHEEIGEPTALFREFAKSETPGWKPLLLAGWGLFALSFLLPGFGIVAFQPSRPDFGMSASGWEFLRLALTNGWILGLLPNLAMVMTLPALGRVRRRSEDWLGPVLGAVSVSALGFGALLLLRPLPVTVDGGFFMYGHLGVAYWVWSASFALVATALWSRGREWAPDRPAKSLA